MFTLTATRALTTTLTLTLTANLTTTLTATLTTTLTFTLTLAAAPLTRRAQTAVCNWSSRPATRAVAPSSSSPIGVACWA